MSNPNYTIRDFDGWSDFEACVELQQQTWGTAFSELVPINVLRVVQRVGGITAGAFDASGALIGFVFGITGIEAGTPVHWSDMLAVRADARDRGIGDALKRYQRSALLDRGVARIYWTFDPLESRNGYVNFVRLGALARKYERNLYGESDSPLHSGIGTDRLIVTWEIASARVTHRLQGEALAQDRWHDVPIANPTRSEAGTPRCEPPRLHLRTDRVRIAIPADIQALKTAAPEIAADWRSHTRAAFESYLDAGYVVEDYLRSEAVGSYVLVRAALLS